MSHINAIIKGFERTTGKHMIEKAFEEMDVGHCTSIMLTDEGFPQIQADEHVLQLASPLQMDDMESGYDVDWNAILPLDEELIYSMRECEAVVIDMLSRFERKKKISYPERKRAYLQHLRYWNHIIETKDINLFIVGGIPHQCYDNVIYYLCKRKGIPTILFYHGILPATVMSMTDWQEATIELKDRYQELREEYAQKSVDEITLSARYQEFFEKQTSPDQDATPWYMDMMPTHPSHRSLAKWCSIAITLLLHKPMQFMKQITSPSFWTQKSEQRATYRFYNKHVTDPDISLPYVYVALHAQPEASTSPLAGAFVDQLLVVQLLAATLPDGILLYVKEHPHQGARCRSTDFYKDLLAINQVRLMPRNLSTYHLIEHSIAIATGSGTVSFEAQCRQKPVLLFGHRDIQYAQGVHSIHTAEDCKIAIEKIVIQKEIPDLKEVKLFFKAYEELQVDGYFNLIFKHTTDLTDEQNSENIGMHLQQKIRTLLK